MQAQKPLSIIIIDYNYSLLMVDVDEGWLHLAKDEIKATLIEDMVALTHPEVHRKPHIEKTTLLVVIARLMKTAFEGK